MSSGNPFGLSEISHFGSFQRVGGKAGGFINKKFFHPSNMQNQEKLWQAQTADARAQKIEEEMEKRREEERQVEDLKKQMYMSGQGGKSDFMSSGMSVADIEKALPGGVKGEMREANEEMRRRKLKLKQARFASGSPDADDGEDDDDGADDGDRKYTKSRFQEDVHPLDHSSVWGSWFSMDSKSWGFTCCRGTKREDPCPEAAQEPADESVVPKPGKRALKKARREELLAAQESPDAQESQAPEDASSSQATRAPLPDAELMDTKMIKAREKRLEQKRQAEIRKEELARLSKQQPAESAYLADLLASPSPGDGAADSKDA